MKKLSSLLLFALPLVITTACDSQVEILPAGVIMSYAGKDVPDGWAHCNGEIVGRDDPKYARLHKAIEYTWGGNGAELFALPDLRGRFLRGVDYGAGHDRGARKDMSGGIVSNVSAGTFQEQATAMPNAAFKTKVEGAHQHTFKATGNNGGGGGDRPGNGDSNESAYDAVTSVKGEHQHVIEGGDEETRPANVAVHWLIKL